MNIRVRDLAKTKKGQCQIKVARGTKSKCEKCGLIINGGRRRLNRHKRERHSY